MPTLMKKLVGLMNDEVLLIFSLGLCFLMAILAEEIGLSTELGAFWPAPCWRGRSTPSGWSTW